MRERVGSIATKRTRVQVVDLTRVEKYCASANSINFENFYKQLTAQPAQALALLRAHGLQQLSGELVLDAVGDMYVSGLHDMVSALAAGRRKNKVVLA